MAAGIGSRFGGGIKQLEPVGLHDEIIMDYSSMMPSKPDLTRSFSLSGRILRRILRSESEIAWRDCVRDLVWKSLIHSRNCITFRVKISQVV